MHQTIQPPGAFSCHWAGTGRPFAVSPNAGPPAFQEKPPGPSRRNLLLRSILYQSRPADSQHRSRKVTTHFLWDSRRLRGATR
jgi:hypothetical protein